MLLRSGGAGAASSSQHRFWVCCVVAACGERLLLVVVRSCVFFSLYSRACVSSGGVRLLFAASTPRSFIKSNTLCAAACLVLVWAALSAPVRPFSPPSVHVRELIVAAVPAVLVHPLRRRLRLRLRVHVHLHRLLGRVLRGAGGRARRRRAS